MRTHDDRLHVAYGIRSWLTYAAFLSSVLTFIFGYIIVYHHGHASPGTAKAFLVMLGITIVSGYARSKMTDRIIYHGDLAIYSRQFRDSGFKKADADAMANLRMSRRD